MRIALSTHLFLDRPLNEDLVKQVQAAGFRDIEIWGMRPHFDYYNIAYLQQLAEALKELKMRVVAVHAPFYAHVGQARAGNWLSLSNPVQRDRNAAVTEIKRLAAVLPELGCSLLVAHPGGLEDEAEPCLQNNLSKSIQELLGYCSAKKIKIALENINSKLATPQAVFNMVKDFNTPYLGMCLDLGHANLIKPPSKILNEVAPELIHIHASDNDGSQDSHQMPYKGTIDWQKVRIMLQKLNYQGAFSWELRSLADNAGILSKIYAKSGEIFPFSGVPQKTRLDFTSNNG